MKNYIVFLLLIFSFFIFFSFLFKKETKVEEKSFFKNSEKIMTNISFKDFSFNEKKEEKEKKLKTQKNKREISNEEWNYIFQLAEKRGYEKREEIGKEKLTLCHGKYLYKNLKKDLDGLFNEMKKNEIKSNLISGFRSVKKQKKIFEEKFFKKCSKGVVLSGNCDKEIIEILKVSSPPGYSKHHTGKVMDFSCGNDFTLIDEFKKTTCYQWLSENDFKNSKKYNFYPSYPEGLGKQGPNPESWEFIWMENKEIIE